MTKRRFCMIGFGGGTNIQKGGKINDSPNLSSKGLFFLTSRFLVPKFFFSFLSFILGGQGV